MNFRIFPCTQAKLAQADIFGIFTVVQKRNDLIYLYGE